MTGARAVRWIMAIVVSAAALVLLTRASSAPITFHGSDEARLRLSWSARPERVEVCRAVSAEELAKRPEHMRQREECEGHFATYAMRVDVDDRLADEAIVHGAGLRQDRPIYLLRELGVPTGRHRIRISLTRREKTDGDAAAFAPVAIEAGADTGRFAGRAQREAAEHSRQALSALPPFLALDTVLTLAPRRVTIVTLNPERRILELLNEEKTP